jgi:hypothetical protein
MMMEVGMVSKRPQFYVRTKSHEWQWDVEEREGSICKEVGIISHHDFQERTMAIAKGEWKPRLTEPKCWFMPQEE